MSLEGALHALVLPEREVYMGFTCFDRGQSMSLEGRLMLIFLSLRSFFSSAITYEKRSPELVNIHSSQI